MRYFLFLALAATLHAESPTPPPAAPQTLRETINSLDPAQIQKAMDALQNNFLAPSSLDEPSRQRALLEGVIRRLSPGAAIVSNNEPASVASGVPYLAEILDDRAGYLRPGAIDAATLGQIDSALASFTEKRLPAVILDLRAVPRGSEFDAAADFARRFSPTGKILFTIQKPSAKQERILTSDQKPLFTGLLVVLVDGNTAGAAEALAATLRINAHAMIVGTDTAGEAVEFAEFPLDGGRKLRVAVSQVMLPNGAAIFPGGVKPDIAVSLAPEVLEEIFLQSREKGVGQFVFEVERARLNEAALVANTNPEIENTPVAKAERNKPVLRDTVLQRAMDLVTAVGFFQKQN
ncbi:MAG: S41 family peptidase [Terrimicrobiaceae bacterium]